MTGSTPVITAEEAAEAATAAPPAPPLPRAAEPVVVPPAPHADADVDLGSAPLTRRQAREQERIKTASVPVIGGKDAPSETADDATEAEQDLIDDVPSAAEPEIVSGVPSFDPPVAAADELDDDLDEQVDVEPVSAAVAVDTVGEVPLTAVPDAESAEPDAESAEDADGVAALGIDVESLDEEQDAQNGEDDMLADVRDADDSDVVEDQRPTVSPEFGSGLLAEDGEEQRSFAPSFDELLTANDSGGSHVASNTLIFNPPAGEGSLSGPVASTGEILVTGSYELPQGIGSQGHAHGTADGKDVDAVLIDGELPPASSPTPIAASSAISTIKPAGEVIRPPAPEKGNRLMLILAIVAGGLALAVGVAVVIAVTTNVF